MPQNLEVKIKFDSFHDIKKTLEMIGARFTSTLNQKDIYYKNSKGLLKLRIENGRETLIQYKRNENSINRWSTYNLLEFSRGNAKRFFRNVFEIETVVEKKRLLYMYKNTRVHLDKIRHLGNYLELETLVINGKNDAKNRFNEIVHLLKLDLHKQIKKSNRDLMLENKK
jgi:predicted adenylyl cyclase CyaB